MMMMMMMMMMLTNKPLPIIFALMQPVAARGSTVRTGDNDKWMRVAWLEESHNCADTSTERGRNFLCCKLKGTPGLIGRFSSNVLGPLLLNHHSHGKRVHDCCTQNWSLIPPFNFFLTAFQISSMVLVWAAVYGSTKFSEWFTMTWVVFPACLAFKGCRRRYCFRLLLGLGLLFYCS